MQAKWRQYTKEQIYEIYNNSQTWTDFFTAMGYAPANDYAYMKKKLQEVYPDIVFTHSKKKVGQRFGKLTLIKDIGRTEKGLIIWECKCDCGNIVQRTTKSLRDSSSCKECLIKNTTESQRKNIKGQIFNFLIPLECVGNVNGNGTRWICKCTLCGKITEPILINNITTGAVKSCGCLKSSGETIVRKTLEELNIKYIQEYSFQDLIGDKKPLRFDFAILNENDEIIYLIECQGEQHKKAIEYFGGEESYQKLVRYDNLKKEYCQKHSYKILYIPYKDYSKINSDYLKNLLIKGEEK